jgi:hypothetical protein
MTTESLIPFIRKYDPERRSSVKKECSSNPSWKYLFVENVVENVCCERFLRKWWPVEKCAAENRTLTTWFGLLVVEGFAALLDGTRRAPAAGKFRSEKGRLIVINNLRIFSTTYGLFQQLTRNFALEAF